METKFVEKKLYSLVGSLAIKRRREGAELSRIQDIDRTT